MAPEVLLYILGPVALIGALACYASTAQILTKGRGLRWSFALAQIVLVVLVAGAYLLAFQERLSDPDWVHLLWSAQYPLYGLFLVSGAMLSRTWCDDAAFIDGQQDGAEPRRERLRWLPGGARLYLLATLALGLMPLLLQLALPDDHPPERATGEPARQLWNLAAWGFGGALPETLTPITAGELRRGVGHLPREVTVPMGSTLLMACSWIAFAMIAFVGRLVRSVRPRVAFYLAVPLVAAAFLPILSRNLFDPGVWKSEPALMRSYGPLLLAGAGAALALLLAQARQRTAPGPVR